MSLPEEKSDKADPIVEEFVGLIVKTTGRASSIKDNAGDASEGGARACGEMDRPPPDVGRQNPLGLRTLSGDRRPQFTSGLPKEGGDFAGVTSKGPVSPPQTNESGEGMKKFPPDLERHVGGGPVGRGAACMTGDTGRARDRGLVIPDLEEASSKTRVHNVGGGSLKEFAMPFD